MITDQNIELFLNTMISDRIWSSSKGNLKFFLNNLFRGIDFNGKSVLDIGGGYGLISFYAACQGAKNVVCLEPEADGSSAGIIDKYERLIKSLKLENVALKQMTLQSYDSEGSLYDIIILHNSINHLNETACVNLLKDDSAKITYKDLFWKIYSIANKDAVVIVCDGSRYNFFALLKLKNPFAPNAEWQKHQAPEVWSKLMREAGFSNPEIRWSSFNRLRNLGRVFFGNKLVAYFLMSHFCIKMKKL